MTRNIIGKQVNAFMEMTCSPNYSLVRLECRDAWNSFRSFCILQRIAEFGGSQRSTVAGMSKFSSKIMGCLCFLNQQKGVRHKMAFGTFQDISASYEVIFLKLQQNLILGINSIQFSANEKMTGSIFFVSVTFGISKKYFKRVKI